MKLKDRLHYLVSELEKYPNIMESEEQLIKYKLLGLEWQMLLSRRTSKVAQNTANLFKLFVTTGRAQAIVPADPHATSEEALTSMPDRIRNVTVIMGPKDTRLDILYRAFKQCEELAMEVVENEQV